MYPDCIIMILSFFFTGNKNKNKLNSILITSLDFTAGKHNHVDEKVLQFHIHFRTDTIKSKMGTFVFLMMQKQWHVYLNNTDQLLDEQIVVLISASTFSVYKLIVPGYLFPRKTFE